MATTYLVTGGAGFIGANFIHYLFDTYGDDVVVHNVDKLTYAGNLENLVSVSDREGYFFHKVDIVDTPALAEVFKVAQPDIVIHFAAESHVDRSIMGSREFVMTNVVGTASVLDLVKEFETPCMVHVSTDEVYGALGAEGEFVETMPLEPNSPYAASKASSDLMVRSYFETHKLPVKITRCSNNYGPYQFPEKLIPLMLSNALHDLPLPVYGKGDNVRDWLYVKDHCSAIDLVARKGTVGEAYNIGGNNEVANIDMVKRILDFVGKPESLIQFVEDRKGHDFRYAIDAGKMKSELGWEPSLQLDEGLDITLNWYLENREWWERIKSGEYQAFYDTYYKERIQS